MTSIEPVTPTKRLCESPKNKSPLKVVSPIIRKYNGHRQGRMKKKLKFPRIIHGKNSKPIKPQLKTILPKTSAGDIIVLEPELLPCALNLHHVKKKVDENENSDVSAVTDQSTESDEKQVTNTTKETTSTSKTNKSKLISTKKKLRYLKSIETTLGLLEPESAEVKEKHEECFAENYLHKVHQTLKGKDEALYNQFVDLICDFEANGMSVKELYKKIMSLFSSHPDLSDDFVAFLTPAQAVECGVFMHHLLLTTMTDFLNLIDIYFSKSPHQIKKIHSVLDSLSRKPDVTEEDVTSSLFPLMKGNSVLMDYFTHFLPHGRPPDNFLMDFEEIEYPELNSDLSDDEDIFETIHLPEVEDPFGGDSCSCNCHNCEEDEKFKTRVHHCISCSTKFINGKIFIQVGKLLRPARVVFHDHDMAFHRDRLAPKLYPKRGRKRSRNVTIFKETLSPTKSCNLSSDEFKSDIEEDEKGRTKSGLCKSPRISRKKSVSPKMGDKSIARCILNELKAETIETDVKASVVKNILEVSKEDNNSEEIVTEEQPKQEVKLSLEAVDDEPEVVKVEDKSSVVIIKEGSKSPPVISIPDSATPLFSDSKPILSLLETLDDSKEPALLLFENEVKSENLMDTEIVVKEEQDEENPWKIEEDRIILQTLQVEENCEQTFIKISNKIPSRGLEEIKKRFATLMNMLYEMKAKTGAN